MYIRRDKYHVLECTFSRFGRSNPFDHFRCQKMDARTFRPHQRNSNTHAVVCDVFRNATWRKSDYCFGNMPCIFLLLGSVKSRVEACTRLGCRMLWHHRLVVGLCGRQVAPDKPLPPLHWVLHGGCAAALDCYSMIFYSCSCTCVKKRNGMLRWFWPWLSCREMFFF